MKKILFIMYDLNGGGAERVLLEILKNLDKSKYQIDLFLLRKQGIYLKEVEKLVEIKSLTGKRSFLNKFILFKKLSSLYREIKIRLFVAVPYLMKLYIKKDYDIEIAFLEGISTKLLSKRKSNSKKITWIHVDLSKSKVDKNIYENFSKIICVSKDCKNSFLKLCPSLEKNVKVVYNPINKNNILEKSKEKIKIKKDKLNIITLGRLTFQKGYDILLQAHNKLIKEGLNYNLIILGEGPERKKLEKFIKENKLEDNIQLLGFKENPYPYLKKADIFISSSRYEGFSLVTAEAICLGKPVIATKCVGPIELLENGKYGLMAETESVNSLVEKMKKLILDEELRKKYSELSKERAKIFNIKRTMQEIEDLLDEK